MKFRSYSIRKTRVTITTMLTKSFNLLKSTFRFVGELWTHASSGFLEKGLLIRSAALSYATVLSLIPLLAISFTVTNYVLNRADPIERQQIIDEVLIKVIPQLELLEEQREQNNNGDSNLLPTRQAIRDQVVHFLEITGSGKIGGIGSVFFVFLGISMIITIEHTFNDIWNVSQGRSWVQRTTLYSSVLTLGLIFFAVSLGFTGRWQASAVSQQLHDLPYFTRIASFLTPFIIFWIGLSLSYLTIPYTNVSFTCAVVGGIFAGTMLQLNNLFNTMYVFQVASYEEFYGGLGILPIVLVGLYIFWFIIVSGAQLTYSLEKIQCRSD